MSSGMMAATMGANRPLSSASANTPVSGFGDGLGGAQIVTTDSSTAVPVGGYGTYTYLWSYVSGDPTATILDPTSADTAFQYNFAATGSASTTFKCTVTNNGISVDTNNVVANFENTL